MNKKTVQNDISKVYMSQRISERLALACTYPLCVIEAPLGCGKTSLLKKYLNESGLMHVFVQVMEESAYLFWKQFVRAFSAIDEQIVEKLQAISCPESLEDVGQAVDAFYDFKPEHDIYLCVDDYHKAASPGLDRFFEELARRQIEGFHIILSGRSTFRSSREDLLLKGCLFAVTQEDLLLNEQECRAYFEECGARYNASDIRKIYHLTEGWAAGLHMIMQYEDIYVFPDIPVIINELFEHSVFSSLSDDQKDFLLRVCIFESFTMEQARFVRRKDDPSAILKQLTDENVFISYDSRHRIYHIHSLFRGFLTRKLSERDIKYRKEAYRHSADWYYLTGSYFNAALCYYRSGNFDDMLKSFERDRGCSLSGETGERMLLAFNACPDELHFKYPAACMILARQLFILNRTEELNKLMEDIKKIPELNRLTEKERVEFEGELSMLKGLLSYNDLFKMNEHFRMAAKNLKRASYIEARRGSWSYGSPSVLYMFLRTPGTLDALVSEMHSSRDLYYKLTDNNGRGGEYIFEAEREFQHCSIDKAEILSYRAYNVGKKYSQTGIQVCSLFLQSRIATFRGNTDDGFKFLKQLQETVEADGRPMFIRTAELCRAFIYSMHNQMTPVEQWIKTGDFENEFIYAPALSAVHIIYGRILLNQNLFSRFLGELDSLLASARRTQSLLTEVYLNIYAAISCREMNMEEAAGCYIRDAVELAYRDKLYIPFVENGRMLFSTMIKAELSEEGEEFVEGCRQRYRRFEKKLNIVLKEDDGSPLNLLTRREQEIALLVVEGNTNMQIANQLNIAEITVKKSLSNIYARLGIKNRTSLIKKLSS